MTRLICVIFNGSEANEYPQSMFWIENKRNFIPLYIPFLLYKSRGLGVYISRLRFPDGTSPFLLPENVENPSSSFIRDCFSNKRFTVFRVLRQKMHQCLHVSRKERQVRPVRCRPTNYFHYVRDSLSGQEI